MSDETDIRHLVADYLACMAESDGAKARAVFHSQAVIAGHDSKGQLNVLDREAFAEFVASRTPSPNAGGQAMDAAILSLRITGDAALVTVQDSYLGRRFTDHLSLLRVDGRWLIFGKIWHAIAATQH